MSTNEKKPNDKLRYQRESRGWSQRKLAELIGTNEGMISRWECGERKPNRQYQEKLCTLFNLPAQALGFFDGLSSLQLSHTIDTISLDQAANDKLDTAEIIVNLAWEAWFASRPQAAAREINRLLPNLEKLLYTASSANTNRIKELVIRSHGLLGAICLDSMQNDTALYHYMQAHKFAEELRDTTLTVTYLALIGDVLRRQNEKTTAIGHMEDARRKASAADKVTQGHILQLLAYTYADTGNASSFEQTIQEATDLLSFTGEGRDTAKKEFNPFEIFEIRGKAYRDLGRPTEAIPYLDLAEKSLSQTETITPRWHALLEISRGQAYCDAGDITTGVTVASKGFTMAFQCHSLRQMNRVRKLVKKLESLDVPYKNDRRVADLKELVRDIYLRMEP